MPQALAGPEIERLIQLLARLPGLGPRSARRAVLHLMRKREDLLLPLAQAMQVAGERIVTCSECGNLDTSDPCAICRDPRRDRSILMVVESVGDLWALERAGALRAAFHVLGGTLSPIDGTGPEDLALGKLLDRATSGEVRDRSLHDRQPRARHARNPPERRGTDARRLPARYWPQDESC